IWERAAKWIAHFHQSFPSPVTERLTADAGLVVYDEAFYWCWIERARCFNTCSEARRGVDVIACDYGGVVQPRLGLKLTLIHGDFYADNVLVSKNGTHHRICPVDWELAALAPGLMDVASLAAGWAEREQRMLARAYFAASPEGLSAKAR